MRVGLIARSDNTGLGYQTLELANMLNPDNIMLIDFSEYNNNKQHPDWYNKFNVTNVKGLPTSRDIAKFIKNLDIVLSCETFYNNQEFIPIARNAGVLTALQYNYELFGNLSVKKMPLPDILISPSYWKVDEIKQQFGKKTKVVHIPPPTNPNRFNQIKENNLKNNHKKLLHIAGKKAAMDRNGTNSIIEMLKHSKANYEIVIRTQSNLNLPMDDSRLIIDYNDHANREDMYDGFDALILPRRYAGLCLPMNEALLSGLPVFMTNISPNNQILPKEWLVDSEMISQFKTKTMIDVYDANPIQLANIIDEYVNLDEDKKYKEYKLKALEIGEKNFLPDNLKNKYIEAFSI